MNAVVKTASNSVIVRMGQRFGVDAEKVLATLKATAFKGEVSNEQMMALLVVADQYGLNPWTREIYAFPDRNGIVPVVGVDGWSRIVNSDPHFDGMDFEDGPLNAQEVPMWIKCTIYRKDRTHPISTKEYIDEVRRDTMPWKTHPRRMLRHKAMIQCARLAFGFVGVFDQDEAERIVEATPVRIDPRPDLSQVDPTLRDKWLADIKSVVDDPDKPEAQMAGELQEIAMELNKFPELYVSVVDEMAKQKICSKANFRKLTAMLVDRNSHQ
jgi:phage recombination protein Bet